MLNFAGNRRALKPRILRIINRLNLGGPTYNAAQLTAGLADAYETRLLAGNRDASEAGSEHILDAAGVEARVIPNMYRAVAPLNDYRAYRAILREIRTFRPNIVHTHAAKAGFLGRTAALRAGVPVVVHTLHGHVFHSYFSPFKTRVFLELERYLARRSSAVVVVAPSQKNELVETYKLCPPERVRVVYNGFDLSRFQENQSALRTAFRKSYRIADDELAVGIVGRLAPVKNHKLFLRAVRELSRITSRRFKAVMVGGGELEAELLQETERLGLSFAPPGVSPNGNEQVVFAGWVYDAERALAGLDVVALTSDNEGAPVSLVEAQAAGRPVVSTDVGGVRDVLLPEQSGLLVPKGEAGAFAEALRRLLEMPEYKRAEMGAAGRAFVTNRFSSERLIADMDALYRELLAKADRIRRTARFFT